MDRRPPRPRVVVHMLSSLDGRIDSATWAGRGGIKQPTLVAAYEAMDRELAGKPGSSGATMEEFAAGLSPDAPSRASQPRTTHRAARLGPYAVVVDPDGKLTWTDGTANGDAVVEILTERVSDARLATLRAAGVSYLFAGTQAIDLLLALAKLREEFGVQRLLLEEGDRLNG